MNDLNHTTFFLLLLLLVKRLQLKFGLC